MVRFLYMIVTILVAFSFIGIEGKNSSFWVDSVFSLLIVLSAYGMFNDSKRPFSLFKMVNLFFLFFLAVAPVVQFKKNIKMWGGEPFTESDYVFTGIVLVVILLLFHFFYNYALSRKNDSFFVIRYHYYPVKVD